MTDDPCDRLRESRLWYAPTFAAMMFVFAVGAPLHSVIEEYLLGHWTLEAAVATGIMTGLVFFVLGVLGLFAAYECFRTELPLIGECDEIDWNPSQSIYTRSYYVPPIAMISVIVYAIQHYRHVRR